MERGLHPLHYGVYLGSMFASPTQFAIAQSRFQKPSQLRAQTSELLKKAAKTISEEDRSKLISLQKALEKAEQQSDETSIIPNSDGFLGTCSDKETVSLKVRSRSGGSPYEVTLYHPFYDGPEDVRSFKAIGGTRHSTKTLARNMHWSKGLQHERHFISNLAETVKNIVPKEDVFRDYEPRTILIDHAIATGLIALQQPAQFKNAGTIPRQVIVPYKFSQQDVLIMLARMRREPFADVDRAYVDALTPFAKKLFAQGVITKGAFLHNKVMPGQAWALIQGLEEMCYRKGYRYAQQYAVEFQKTDFETISSVFNRGENSVRIIFDEHSMMPYMLFKKPGVGVARVPRNPYQLLNPGRGRLHMPSMHWTEIDHHTGRKMDCALYEPSSAARDCARAQAQFSGRNLDLGVVAQNYRGAWRNHKN